MQGQVNRFDFLRLAFASTVAIYHAFVLAKIAPRLTVEKYLGTAAELSIQGFFIISGCLVLGSLIRSEKIGVYTEKRIRRLYPAYAVIILIPALIALFMGGAFNQVLAYILPNLAFLNFLEPTLPGLFGDNPMPAVNGALWTLKIEVMFYMALPIIWWFIRRPGALCTLAWIAMFVGAELWRQYFMQFDHGLDASLAEKLSRQLPGQMGYFAIGMLINQKWHRLTQPKFWWALTGIALIALSLWQPLLHILRPIGLGLVIVWIAFSQGPALNAARYGDMSYGIYITHFPIIQACIAAGLFTSPVLGLSVSLGLTLIASFALWHLVEKRALLPSSHYRKTS